VAWGEWQQINIVHHSASRNLRIYLDGILVLNTTISASNGTVDWYNKFGVYGREGMGAFNEIWYKDVQYFHSDNPVEAPDTNVIEQDPMATDTTFTIPGRIETELFSAMFGVDTQTTSDVDGNLNVGWVDAGDWLEYQVDVATAGDYDFKIRMASTKDSGAVVLKSGDGVLGEAPILNTGGWQTWETAVVTVNLDSGVQTLRLEFTGSSGGLVNLNWMDVVEFEEVTTGVLGVRSRVKGMGKLPEFDFLGRRR